MNSSAATAVPHNGSAPRHSQLAYPYTSSTWIQYTNKECRPIIDSGCSMARNPVLRSRKTPYVAANAIIRMPVRMENQVGELVQNDEA